MDALESDGLEPETDTPSEKDFEHILDSNSDTDAPLTSNPINPRKKRRLMNQASTTLSRDDMPQKYLHICESIRKVKPAFYETEGKLKSTYHMSATQTEAAVVEVGNKLFNREWKFHEEDNNIIDLDTLPQTKNIRYSGKKIEALALDEIVKEIMESNENTTVTYSDDESKKQGCGSFSVQGLTVNGKYRSLPTLNIASESRENLADLKLAILDILSAASGVNSKSLFEKNDFVITDRAAHNFGVEEHVAAKLDSDHIPNHLHCSPSTHVQSSYIKTMVRNGVHNWKGQNIIELSGQCHNNSFKCHIASPCLHHSPYQP